MSNTPSDAEIEALVKRHGATSYRNRADTQHPAYGFTENGLNGLIDEVLAKWAAPRQEAQEPTTVDKKTMELAESVGLIGPASRVGDLHAAIQRFHDLICVNATIKAAVMAAEAIGKQQAAPQQEAQEPVAYVEVSQSDAEVSMTWGPEPAGFNLPTGRYALYTSPQPAPAPLSEMPYEKRKAIQEGEQIGASDAWFHARINMLDTLDRRNVFRAGFDRGWNAALAAQGGK